MSTPAFDALNEGDTLPELRLPPITRHQLALYCGGSGDHNPIHVDIDFAKKSGMKDVFAHGMLSMAFMGRLITNWVSQSSIKSFGVRFMAITWPGDQITVTARVKKKDIAERLVELELVCTTQNGDTTLQGHAVVLFPGDKQSDKDLHHLKRLWEIDS